MRHITPLNVSLMNGNSIVIPCKYGVLIIVLMYICSTKSYHKLLFTYKIVYMKAQKISLKESEVKPVVDHLNDLLANYHIHYQKLRGCHWNIKGQNFFTLHLKFEELYTQALLTIDELAERILTLGKSPYSTFNDYIKKST